MKEFKIVKIDHKEIKKDDYSYVERLLADFAAEGWQVISVAPDYGKDLRGDLLITLGK